MKTDYLNGLAARRKLAQEAVTRAQRKLTKAHDQLKRAELGLMVALSERRDVVDAIAGAVTADAQR